MNIKTKEFIEKTNIVHGDKYLYDEVEYINNKTKVCIICRDHGKFWQRPDAHLSQKQGCPICSRIESDKKRRYTIEKWEQKAKLVHEGKYDYTKIVYQGSINKVCIICPEHGEFWQEANAHLQGQGCSKCEKVYNYTTEEWIEEAKKIHGKNYDYSKVNYVNAKVKVCIICPEHGEFWQLPSQPLQGTGWPICNASKLEKYVKLILNNN